MVLNYTEVIVPPSYVWQYEYCLPQSFMLISQLQDCSCFLSSDSYSLATYLYTDKHILNLSNFYTSQTVAMSTLTFHRKHNDN